MSYQDRMHSHVDSADTNQDTPAQSHTQAEEEGVLKEKTIRHSHQHASRQGHKGSGVFMPPTSLHACMHMQRHVLHFLYWIAGLSDYACVCCPTGLFYHTMCVPADSLSQEHSDCSWGAHHFI